MQVKTAKQHNREMKKKLNIIMRLLREVDPDATIRMGKTLYGFPVYLRQPEIKLKK